ncbi:MAG: hypothetical protein LBF42_02485 [Puniceicoccales bacterium]|jgi:hypothetical protein|nr:hypothetical protein [Puniceicoccales bacterium]
MDNITPMRPYFAPEVPEADFRTDMDRCDAGLSQDVAEALQNVATALAAGDPQALADALRARERFDDEWAGIFINAAAEKLLQDRAWLLQVATRPNITESDLRAILVCIFTRWAQQESCSNT